MGQYAVCDLQYLWGLKELGHDVYYLEESGNYASCFSPHLNYRTMDPTYGLNFASGVLEEAGLGARWLYYDTHTNKRYGPCAERINEICADADLLINLSGVNRLLDPWEKIPVRVLIDEDPAFTQSRHLNDPVKHRAAQGHNAFFSYAHNFGAATCSVPDDGFPWLPTRPPVCLSTWPALPAPDSGFLTTVMRWHSYDAQKHEGRVFGMKSDSFAAFLDLPRRASPVFELAILGERFARPILEQYGWKIRDALDVTTDVKSYQRYIQESKAEFSVAKQGYVATWSGWFSERSANYLSSGRPVVVQDTGFSDWLEAGPGVIPFRDPEEALEGVEDMCGRYAEHCRGARMIAEEYFSADKVLAALIDRAMTSSAGFRLSSSKA